MRILFVTLFLLLFPGPSPIRGEDNLLLSVVPVLAVRAENVPTPAPRWWRPRPGTSWQWQLSGPVDTSIDVHMYDIDLFDSPTSLIDRLHRDGRVVICSFSAGSLEQWRPDRDRYPEIILGLPLDGWPEERWVDIRRLDILGPILEHRLDLAVSKGCDGVEPDNVDGFTHQSGFPLRAEDQRAFNRWLAAQAHRRGLSVGLKNDLSQVAELAEDFDWALNEECFAHDECDRLLPFLRQDKAVFGVEYEGRPEDFCPRANRMNMDWLKKNLSLDAWRVPCR